MRTLNSILPGLLIGGAGRLVVVVVEGLAETIRRADVTVVVVVALAVEVVRVVVVRAADGVAGFAGVGLLVGAEGTRLVVVVLVPGVRLAVSVTGFFAGAVVRGAGVGLAVVVDWAGVAFFSGDNWVGRAGLLASVGVDLLASVGDRRGVGSTFLAVTPVLAVVPVALAGAAAGFRGAVVLALAAPAATTAAAAATPTAAATSTAAGSDPMVAAVSEMGLEDSTRFVVSGSLLVSICILKCQCLIENVEINNYFTYCRE